MDLSDLSDLADDELHARLTQAGADPGLADRLVSRRDDPDYELRIAVILDPTHEVGE